MQLTVTGTLTVEQGGAVDVTGQGFAERGAWPPGPQAPEGVRSAGDDMAGSHGGIGSSGAEGYAEAYGSIFEPDLGGGGSGGRGGRDGASGGGVAILDVGTLVLDGAVVADGDVPPSSSSNCGAGGSIFLTAGVVTGSGVVGARGGSFRLYSDGGGGGRIALLVDQFLGFDPDLQVTADGGPRLTSAGEPIFKIGGHGTVLIKRPESVSGDLYVGTGDCGGIPVGVTPLSGVGPHVAGVVAIDPVDPMDVWVEPEDPLAQYALGVVGLWVRSGGADYRVIAQDGRRRILIQDAAGGIDPGDEFYGVAKLDSIHVRGCGNLVLGDVTEYDDLVVDPPATVTDPNDGPPRVNPALIRYSVDGNVYTVWESPVQFWTATAFPR